MDDSLVPADSIEFDKDEVKKNLTLFLYPDDSDEKGRLLRVYQQYFMVSNAAEAKAGSVDTWSLHDAHVNEVTVTATSSHRRFPRMVTHGAIR